MRKLCTILPLISGLFWGLTTQAQVWTFGPQIKLPLSFQTQTSTFTSASATLDAGGQNESLPVHVGVFARYDKSRFYGQLDAFSGGLRINNYVLNSRGNGYSTSFKARSIGGRLVGGYKPLPWLRLFGAALYQQMRYPDAGFGAAANRIDERIKAGGINGVQLPDDPWQAHTYRLLDATNQAYAHGIVSGQVGLGVDIGGLMLDLSYEQGLTPFLKTIPGTVTDRPQGLHHRSYGLTVAYRLLPISYAVTASRRNRRTYERVQQQIPYYRNEFHLGVGLLGEDIGSAFIYENRYTRYVTRRVGFSAGLNLMQAFADAQSGFLPKTRTTASLITGIRLLPLYSRRHTIGITTGPTLTYELGLKPTVGAVRNQLSLINLRADSGADALRTGWQSTLDYQFAMTDRLIIGPWLRLIGQEVIVPDYATFGIQTGYRF